MHDDVDVTQLLADPESWTTRERRFMEATLEQQRHELCAARPQDTKGRELLSSGFESIEKALKRANGGLAVTLTDIPDEQLLDVLRRVFAQRRPNPEEDSYNRNRFYLGTASQLLDDDGLTWEPWETEAVAYPDVSVYGDGTVDGPGFCQFGECQTCGTRVRCNAKHGVCPICEASVYLT